MFRAVRMIVAGAGGALVVDSTIAIGERCGFPAWPALIVAILFGAVWLGLVGWLAEVRPGLEGPRMTGAGLMAAVSAVVAVAVLALVVLS